ncbi:hypothetical protein LIER_19775 [Lithospermum erythrorhizon]|uniref:Reverse transcriptase/retrotransposon-derived protein RNase H-like domain-containing protein n=1 Tax=Lithospermum erythrorhizon TaxID=34254 RepID=A0AAV3QJX6_LITER
MLINSREAADHEANLQESFENLRRYNLQLNSDNCVFYVTSGKFLGYMIRNTGIEPNDDKIDVVQTMQSPQTQKEGHRLTGRIAALTYFGVQVKQRPHPGSGESVEAGVLCQPGDEGSGDEVSPHRETRLCPDC